MTRRGAPWPRSAGNRGWSLHFRSASAREDLLFAAVIGFAGLLEILAGAVVQHRLVASVCMAGMAAALVLRRSHPFLVLVAVLFLFLIYLFHTTGELCLSPVGLSAMNRLAPRHMASLIMGGWFFATAGGNFVAGKIGEATGGGEGGAMSRDGTLEIYWTIGLVSIGVGIVVLVISPLVKRLMHLDTLSDDDDLAGKAELGEPAASGMHPDQETRPAGSTI